jgi:hypothetical protein
MLSSQCAAGLTRELCREQFGTVSFHVFLKLPHMLVFAGLPGGGFQQFDQIIA